MVYEHVMGIFRPSMLATGRSLLQDKMMKCIARTTPSLRLEKENQARDIERKERMTATKAKVFENVLTACDTFLNVTL